ncbi:MAG: SDR family oxidoreductase [Alphaproteobacteria bacterium]|jgi:NAD(P)-dependent dehydrogenase (short-subunit alcohol dehydrogenase family)|nr:SDR family oxidoreductase [Alphaproteobacteria bacterium]
MIKQKTLLITGGAKRIGKSITTHFAKQGWNTAIHYNTSKDEALELSNELSTFGTKSAIFQADLSDEASYSTLIKRINNDLGPLDCLINNASSFEYDSVQTADRNSWDLHMETNLRAPFVLSQQFVKQLPDNASGNIINILDQRVWNLTPHFISYTLSKSGLWTLTQTLALALSPKIRVNAIGPGPTLMNHKQSEDHFKKQCQNTPLQKAPELKEIAEAIQFILNAHSLTGQMLALDGGQHMGWAFPNQSISVYD